MVVHAANTHQIQDLGVALCRMLIAVLMVSIVALVITNVMLTEELVRKVIMS